MKRIEFEDCRQCPYLKKDKDFNECTKTGLMFRNRRLPHYIGILFQPVREYEALLSLCPLEEVE